MRLILFTLLLLAGSAVLAATVYRWVDENGVVHYSDQPHPNAEKLQVAAPQTYQSTPVSSAPPQDSGASTAATGYLSCAIAQPADGQDFANIPALGIVVRTNPNLHPGDQIFIMVDGGLVNGGSATGSSFSVSPIERGTHTVQALIRDAGGGLACQSPPITINVHQASLASPSNPIRPH
jgi:hypothetical protein